MADLVVTLNAGSSSLKFALFAKDAAWPRRVASGQVERQVESLGEGLRLHARIVDGDAYEMTLPSADYAVAINAVFDWVHDSFSDTRIVAIGHRVVHGGSHFATPIVVDGRILAQLRDLIALAPLHQPHNLAGLEAARAAFPDIPQVACFDTAFHRGHAFVNDVYALPRAYYSRGFKRFGFHGLSYEFISRRLREIDPIRAAGRVVVAHLGNGASLCAMNDGRSVASSMGFSALDGLPMGTRCGQIDPGLVLYLLEHEKLSFAEVSHLLYEQSGLLGLSGLSHDLRVLEASSCAAAREAIEYFIHRIKIEIGALVAALGGVDALVFTAGIGEHSARVREGVVNGLEWLGFKLDAAANARNHSVISCESSPLPVYVTPTDEEAMIAHHTLETTTLRA